MGWALRTDIAKGVRDRNVKGNVVVYLWMYYVGFVCPRMLFSAGNFLFFTYNIYEL